RERQLKSATESYSMHRRDGGHRRRIDGVHHPMNPLEKDTYLANCIAGFNALRALIQFAQIGAGRKSSLDRGMEDQRMGLISQVGDRPRQLFQFFEGKRSNLVARLAMQRHLYRAVYQLPRERTPFELDHAVRDPSGLTPGSLGAPVLARYISSISLL